MFRAPSERRKKKEALSEEQPRALGQRLLKGEGAQVTGNKTRDASDDKAAEDRASPGKRESRKDARGKASCPGEPAGYFPFQELGPGGEGGADGMGPREWRRVNSGYKVQVCRATVLRT